MMSCGWTQNILWQMEYLAFYREVLGAWGEFLERVRVTPRGRTQLLGQPLFLNKNIMQHGSTLFFRKWWAGGIRQVRDVMYEVREGFLPVQVIVDAIKATEQEERLDVIERQFGGLQEAIPSEWIKVIEGEGQPEGDGKYPEVSWIKDTGEQVNFVTLTIKTIYDWFRDRASVKPTANAYGKDRFEGLTDDDIWGNVRLRYMDPVLENFTFLQRHNWLLSEMRLCKMGLQADATCSVCGEGDEGLFHLFLYCRELDGFMCKLRNVVKRFESGVADRVLMQMDWERLILFGPRRGGRQQFMFHLLIAVARYSIWTRRNVAKHRTMYCDVWRIFVAKMRYFMGVLRQYFLMQDEQDVLGDVLWWTDL